MVEDTDYTLDDIAALDFGAEVVEALSLLTYDEATPYLEYIASLRSNPIARAVKRADLLHNSDLSRLDTVTLKDEERGRKYKAALAILDN